MKMFMLALVFCVIGCNDVIDQPIENGGIEDVDIDAITLNCDGYSWAVCLDEPYRLNIWKATGEIIFLGVECTGTTMFSTDFYDYIYSETEEDFRSQITAADLWDEVDDFYVRNFYLEACQGTYWI